MSTRLSAFAMPSKPVCWGLTFLFPSASFLMPAERMPQLTSRAPKLLLFIVTGVYDSNPQAIMVSNDHPTVQEADCVEDMVRSYPSCVPGRYISSEQDKAKDADCSVLSAEIPIIDLALLSDGHEKELIKRRTGQGLPKVGLLSGDVSSLPYIMVLIQDG
ncbi:hypothetical protein RJ639_015447 [Escallonia herrerae]|uniref:Uncharacterized protein n=1 Tax=Escallonia herrerae TaxID=1293975 RepID=A0AA88VIB2_9ASTE|nr:hypothetical protein RJ639_015447 [Escallonia herrerae]